MKQRTRFLQRFALLLAAQVAVLSPGLARADLVAGWVFREGDSGTLTSNGYTLNLNGNTVSADGYVTIGDTNGLSIDFVEGDAFYNTMVITAVMEVSNLPVSGTVLDTVIERDDNFEQAHLGLSVTAGTDTDPETDTRTLAQRWRQYSAETTWNDTTYNSGTLTDQTTTHRFAFAYRYVNENTDNRGARTFFDDESGIDNSRGLYSSVCYLRTLNIGAFRGSYDLATGMRIHSIKLYTTKFMETSEAAAAANDIVVRDGETKAFEEDATVSMVSCGAVSTGVTVDVKGHAVALSVCGAMGDFTVNDSAGEGSAALTVAKGFAGTFADGSAASTVTLAPNAIPSSGGETLPSGIALVSPTGTTFASDGSITLGASSKIEIPYAATGNAFSVMLKTTSMRSDFSPLVGIAITNNTNNYEIALFRTTTGFRQTWIATDGTANSATKWGTGTWTDDGADHRLLVAYSSNNDSHGVGTHTFLDGDAACSGTDMSGLRWHGYATTKITIGGILYASAKTGFTTNTAAGMVIKDLQIYTTALVDTESAAVNTALASSDWTVNADGTSVSGSFIGGEDANHCTAIVPPSGMTVEGITVRRYCVSMTDVTLGNSTAQIALSSTSKLLLAGTTSVLGVISGDGSVEVSGTATLSGTNTYTGGTRITGSVTMPGVGTDPKNYSCNGLGSGTITGTDTAVITCNGGTPANVVGLTNGTNWRGTVVIKDFNGTGQGANEINLDAYGHANSNIAIEGIVQGWVAGGTRSLAPVEIKADSSLVFNNGSSSTEAQVTLDKLTGAGTLKGPKATAFKYGLFVKDASEFEGSVNLANGAGGGIALIFGAKPAGYAAGTYAKSIVVLSGNTAKIAAGQSWTPAASGSVQILGAGSLECAGTISGNVSIAEGGTLVFNAEDADTVTLSNAISGAGAVSVASGTLRLASTSAGAYANTVGFSVASGAKMQVASGSGTAALAFESSGNSLITVDGTVELESGTTYRGFGGSGDVVVTGDFNLGVASSETDKSAIRTTGNVTIDATKTLTVTNWSGANYALSSAKTLQVDGALAVSNGTVSVTVPSSGALKGAGSAPAAIPVTFADGATLDATAGAPTLSGTVAYSGAVTVKLSDAPTTDGTKVVNGNATVPGTATIKVGDATVVAALLVADDGSLWAKRPSVPGSVTDATAAQAVAEAAAAAGKAEVTIGSSFNSNVAAVFSGNIAVSDEGEVTTTALRFGTSKLYAVHDGSAYQIVVKVEAPGLSDGATLTLTDTATTKDPETAEETVAETAYTTPLTADELDDLLGLTPAANSYYFKVPLGGASHAFTVTAAKTL